MIFRFIIDEQYHISTGPITPNCFTKLQKESECTTVVLVPSTCGSSFELHLPVQWITKSPEEVVYQVESETSVTLYIPLKLLLEISKTALILNGVFSMRIF